MADKKISALTGATTPLAGTEVLPIVQGGSTVKVSIANVTAGRAVSFLNSTWNTTGFCDGSYLGLVNTNPAAYGQRLVIGNYSDTSATLNGVQIATNKAILTAFADGAVNGNGATVSVAWANGGQGPLKLAIGATTTLQLEANGDVAAKTGNLVIGTAGKGIDFSANGGDVLSQYDEGTWTPVATGIVINSGTPVWSGTYTRVGRMVVLQWALSGGANIDVLLSSYLSLPFTALGNSWGTYGNVPINTHIGGIVSFGNLLYFGTAASSLSVASGTITIQI
jgi:hypothetical protein